MKEILVKLRTENRYSQNLLAQLLGISRQAYMKYESGVVEPSIETVRKLSKIYKVPYAYLIDNGETANNLAANKPAANNSNKEIQKNVAYARHNYGEFNVAEPAVSYGNVSFFDKSEVLKDNAVYEKEKNPSSESEIYSYFMAQLDYLKEIIVNMQNQLEISNVTQNASGQNKNNNKSFSKSKSFNKAGFFNQLAEVDGKLNMDSSYIDELREISRI